MPAALALLPPVRADTCLASHRCIRVYSDRGIYLHVAHDDRCPKASSAPCKLHVGDAASCATCERPAVDHDTGEVEF